MGAIYGVLGGVAPGLLKEMGVRLKHRGRCTREWVINETVSLGECIHQPTPSPLVSENVALVADGDIYNATDLREKLSLRGCTFITDRDEEVILRGYMAFGAEICKQLNGDYAFALWDERRSTLLLARDPLGSRPLYYWQGTDQFAFASEYKALLALPFVPSVPDLDVVQVLQYTKYPPPNRTLLKDIVSVPAGHFLEYVDGDHQLQRYWTVTVDPVDLSEREHIENLYQQFLSTIKRQVGDLAEVGVTLSGGVDSAAIVAAVKKVKPEITLHTFTCGYGPEDPEIRTAEVVAKSVGTTHHTIIFKPRVIPSLLSQLVWHLEDPIARSETALNFQTAKYASQLVDVVLAGHAGDGLYGGMPRHKIVKLIQWFPLFRTPLEEFYNYTQTSTLPGSTLGKLLHWAFFRGANSPPPAVLGASIRPTAASLPKQRKELLNQVLANGMINGVTKWLPKVDRTHFAHGLKYRSPFTDVELMDLAFQIPDRYKIRRWREKHIFREAVRPLLPPEVLNRPKFPQAMEYNEALSVVIERVARNVLSPEAVKARGYFDMADIESLLQRQPGTAYSGEQSMRLWTAILTELWAQVFVDNRGAEPVN